MIHRQHRVGLAAAKGRLQLDDRFATLAVEPLRHLGEQLAHTFSNEGAFIKRLRVAVFWRRLARPHGGQVSCKFGLLERAIQHVAVRNDDFTPWLQAHSDIPIIP